MNPFDDAVNAALDEMFDIEGVEAPIRKHIQPLYEKAIEWLTQEINWNRQRSPFSEMMKPITSDEVRVMIQSPWKEH